MAEEFVREAARLENKRAHSDIGIVVAYANLKPLRLVATRI
jgi:hypothetical protein